MAPPVRLYVLLALVLIVGLLVNVGAKSSKHITKQTVKTEANVVDKTDLHEIPVDIPTAIKSKSAPEAITIPVTTREKFIADFRSILGGPAFKYAELPGNLRSHAIVEEGTMTGTETTEGYSITAGKTPVGTAYKYIQIDEYTEHGCLGKLNMSKAYIADVCVATSNSTSELYNFYVSGNSYVAVLSMWLNVSTCHGPSDVDLSLPGSLGCMARMKVSTPWFLFRPTYDAEFEK